MEESTIIYNNVKGHLDSVLTTKGFIKHKEEIFGSFGSSYIQYKNNTHVIRFVWDNRESWFVLEETLNFSKDTFGNWKDIYLCRMPRKKWSESKIRGTIEEFNKIISSNYK